MRGNPLLLSLRRRRRQGPFSRNGLACRRKHDNKSARNAGFAYTRAHMLAAALVLLTGALGVRGSGHDDDYESSISDSHHGNGHHHGGGDESAFWFWLLLALGVTVLLLLCLGVGWYGGSRRREYYIRTRWAGARLRGNGQIGGTGAACGPAARRRCGLCARQQQQQRRRRRITRETCILGGVPPPNPLLFSGGAYKMCKPIFAHL